MELAAEKGSSNWLKFQSCSEASAQEVSYHLLSHPLSLCSRANVYINTNAANKRVRTLKYKPVLMGMEQDSVDILLSGLMSTTYNDLMS